jgi:hypothetical protein
MSKGKLNRQIALLVTLAWEQPKSSTTRKLVKDGPNRRPILICFTCACVCVCVRVRLTSSTAWEFVYMVGKQADVADMHFYLSMTAVQFTIYPGSAQ